MGGESIFSSYGQGFSSLTLILLSPASNAGGKALELPWKLRSAESMPMNASLVLTARVAHCGWIRESGAVR